VKVIENHYRGDWRDKLLNSFPLLLDTDYIGTLAFAWDAEGPYAPEDYSLFYNGFFMVRLNFPFGIFLHIKPVRGSRFQMGVGWKLNGRFGLILRWQTDTSAAAGTHGPNVGQASAWSRGTA
jgi:hypothetical protein